MTKICLQIYVLLKTKQK